MQYDPHFIRKEPKKQKYREWNIDMFRYRMYGPRVIKRIKIEF